MEKLKIICIDDQREILAAIRRDLAPLSDYCSMIDCETAKEAEEVLDEIDARGEHLALVICDHIMPGKNGVEFLIEFNEDLRFSKAKKLLLTGMATHQDTIVAINEANIDRYVEKPWDPEQLISTVQVLVTRYLLESGVDYEPYLPVLDQATLYSELRKQT